jgi:hypothetical protein
MFSEVKRSASEIFCMVTKPLKNVAKLIKKIFLLDQILRFEKENVHN